MFPFSKLLPGSNGMMEFDAIKHKTSSQSCNLSQYAKLIKSCKILAQNVDKQLVFGKVSMGGFMNNKIFA